MSSLDNEGREFYPGTFAFRPRELTVVGSGGVFFFFLTVFWLSHGQRWAILKGTASLTRY